MATYRSTYDEPYPGRSEPALFASEPIPQDELSLSAINAYRACPLRYYFRHVAKLPERSVSASQMFREALHQAIRFYFERLLASRTQATLDALVHRYCQAFEEQERSQIKYGMDDRAGLDLLASRMLRVFLCHPVTHEPGRILAVSQEVGGQLATNLPPWSGRVDMVAKSQGDLLLRDWRISRTSLTTDQIIDAWLSLALAAESMQPLAFGKPVRLDLIVLTKTKELAIDRRSQFLTPALVERSKRIVERSGHAIAAKIFYPAPSPIICSTCPFQDACRAWPG